LRSSRFSGKSRASRRGGNGFRDFPFAHLHVPYGEHRFAVHEEVAADPGDRLPLSPVCAITKKRLLAGLGTSGVPQLLFVIAEEGITAAAYAVITIVNGNWTIEECGERDASGPRVGAILQALIAREPVERRPVIRGWLPPGFGPPQVTTVSTQPAAEILLARPLTVTVGRLALFSDDVLYWRSDVL
jgi:hypothetical protein